MLCNSLTGSSRVPHVSFCFLWEKEQQATFIMGELPAFFILIVRQITRLENNIIPVGEISCKIT